MTQVDGINPGEVVANSSFDKLQDNAKVAVCQQPATTPRSTNRPTAGSNAP